MNREKAEAFVEAALANLDTCQNDMQVVEWDSETSSHREYLELSVADINRLEEAYEKKVRWIVGMGG